MIDVKELLTKIKIIENDTNLIFDEPSHTYTYKGKKMTSVTTFLKSLHEEFDFEKVLERTASKRNVDKDKLGLEWKTKNENSKIIGSFVHNYIEFFYKQMPILLPNLNTHGELISRVILNKIHQFNRVYNERLYKLTPVKNELRLYSKKYPIAGTFDGLYYNEKGIYVLDWKTNDEFRDDNHPKGTYQKFYEPFSKYYVNHYNEYSLQLSLYKILLSEWGINVDNLFVVYLSETEYKIHKCIDFSKELTIYLNTVFQTENHPLNPNEEV